MDIKERYLIIANGNPFFAAISPENLLALIDEAKRNFGTTAKIEVFKQTTAPFAIHAAKVDPSNSK